jgi:hypothetical protein
LENRIKNVKGQSTSSEEAPEYFGAKRRLSLKNENIMCDKRTLKPQETITKKVLKKVNKIGAKLFSKLTVFKTVMSMKLSRCYSAFLQFSLILS